MLLSWELIFFFNLPGTYYLTADAMTLVSPPSSNGWTLDNTFKEQKILNYNYNYEQETSFKGISIEF